MSTCAGLDEQSTQKATVSLRPQVVQPPEIRLGGSRFVCEWTVSGRNPHWLWSTDVHFFDIGKGVVSMGFASTRNGASPRERAASDRTRILLKVNNAIVSPRFGSSTECRFCLCAP